MAKNIRAGNTKTELRYTFAKCIVAYILFLNPEISIEELTTLFVNFYEDYKDGRDN